MKKHRILWTLVLIFSVVFLDTDVIADDQILDWPLESGVYNNSDGGIIAQDNCVVNEGNIVLCVATGNIILKDGFHAKPGSTFVARIGDYGDLSNDTDDDADELPDWWEQLFFDDLSQGRDADYDEDGFTNYQEYVLGSNPAHVDDTPDPGYYYEYDALGRLKKLICVSQGQVGYEIEYEYDSVGNRTSKIVK